MQVDDYLMYIIMDVPSSLCIPMPMFGHYLGEICSIV